MSGEESSEGRSPCRLSDEELELLFDLFKRGWIVSIVRVDDPSCSYALRPSQPAEEWTGYEEEYENEYYEDEGDYQEAENATTSSTEEHGQPGEGDREGGEDDKVKDRDRLGGYEHALQYGWMLAASWKRRWREILDYYGVELYTEPVAVVAWAEPDRTDDPEEVHSYMAVLIPGGWAFLLWALAALRGRDGTWWRQHQTPELFLRAKLDWELPWKKEWEYWPWEDDKT